MSDDKFKYHLGNLDSDNRVCLKILYNMIRDLSMKKIEIHPDILRAFESHEKDINNLVDQGNKICVCIDALENKYNEVSKLPKILVDSVYEDVEKRKEEYIETMEDIDKGLAEKIIELKELKDYFENIFNKMEKMEIFKKLNILKYALDPPGKPGS